MKSFINFHRFASNGRPEITLKRQKANAEILKKTKSQRKAMSRLQKYILWTLHCFLILVFKTGDKL